jgi:hypothetical protein
MTAAPGALPEWINDLYIWRGDLYTSGAVVIRSPVPDTLALALRLASAWSFAEATKRPAIAVALSKDSRDQLLNSLDIRTALGPGANVRAAALGMDAGSSNLDVTVVDIEAAGNAVEVHNGSQHFDDPVAGKCTSRLNLSGIPAVLSSAIPPPGDPTYRDEATGEYVLGPDDITTSEHELVAAGWIFLKLPASTIPAGLQATRALATVVTSIHKDRQQIIKEFNYGM